MWYRDRLEEERTGIPSTRGERYARYTDEQKRAAMDHYLEYGRRPGRAMRMLGYPRSRDLLVRWIDELAPGERLLRRGPVPEELKREAVVAVASGRLKSREAAERLGVEASIVRNWKRQMLDEPKERAMEKPVGRGPDQAAPTAGSGPDAASVEELEARLAELRGRMESLAGDVERMRAERADLDIEIAIRRGTLELLGKERAQTRTT
ncbi:hypothetical protein [Bifidobacterium eulemuris]|nr:hypothetical protein [Bifidobacterium eulemuris]